MDRERLKEVRQTDLTEGRINQDFVDWLKTKGTSWLLVILVALCIYAGVVRWKSHGMNYRTEAWTELDRAALPASLEDVAEKYTDVGAVSLLARLEAGQMLLGAVQSGKTLEGDVQSRQDLTEEQREDYLAKADRNFAKIIEADDQSPHRTLLSVTALTGRAAVAESRGELDQAQQFHEQAAARAETAFPALADHSRKRAASIQDQTRAVTLPTRQQITELDQAKPPTAPLDPISLEPWASELILPKSGQ